MYIIASISILLFVNVIILKQLHYILFVASNKKYVDRKIGERDRSL
jgi:hypothetical protein